MIQMGGRAQLIVLDEDEHDEVNETGASEEDITEFLNRIYGWYRNRNKH